MKINGTTAEERRQPMFNLLLEYAKMQIAIVYVTSVDLGLNLSSVIVVVFAKLH